MNKPDAQPKRLAKSREISPLNEDVVQATASILGPNSAAARALADAIRRRAAGETVEFWRQGHTIIVEGRAS